MILNNLNLNLKQISFQYKNYYINPSLEEINEFDFNVTDQTYYVIYTYKVEHSFPLASNIKYIFVGPNNSYELPGKVLRSPNKNILELDSKTSFLFFPSHDNKDEFSFILNDSLSKTLFLNESKIPKIFKDSLSNFDSVILKSNI